MSVFLAESRKRNRVYTVAYMSNAPFKIFINSLGIFYNIDRIFRRIAKA